MTRLRRTLVWVPAALLLFAPALFAQPAPDSASYSELQNRFTVYFDTEIQTTGDEFIVAGIKVDDDNGGPVVDFVLRGGTVLNADASGTTIRFSPMFGAVIGEYTYTDDAGGSEERQVWGTDYGDIVEIEEELRHTGMRLFVPAGAAVDEDGTTSSAGWVDLEYTEVADAGAVHLDNAAYDANTNTLTLAFDHVMQFDQLPEDIAGVHPDFGWPVAGNGELDVTEDRNDNGVLDMEQNVVVSGITITGAGGDSFTLESAMTRADNDTLALQLSPSNRAAVEALDTSALTITFGAYTFVDENYNPAVPVTDIAVDFTAETDPVDPLSAEYDMGDNTLKVAFDQALATNVSEYAVIPKLIVKRNTTTYALEAGTPGLADQNMSFIASLGVGTAQAVEGLVDQNGDGAGDEGADFEVTVRANAVLGENGNGNHLGTVDLEIIPETDRNKAPAVDFSSEPYYDAGANELYVLFDVRLDQAVTLTGFHFVSGQDTVSLTGGTADRTSGNKALSIILNMDDRYAVENTLDTDNLTLLIDPYSVKQQTRLNGNRAIAITGLSFSYMPDPNAPLVEYVWYDEVNQRLVIGSNVTVPAESIDLTQLTLSGHTFAAADSLRLDEANRISAFVSAADADAVMNLPEADRINLSLEAGEGFFANGDGFPNEPVSGLADGDTTSNEVDQAVLTLGFGREFWVRSYEAFPTVPRKVAASVRRVSEGAYWYVANDQWAPYQPFARREGKSVEHPIVTALRPAELDSAVAFFEDNTPRSPENGARDVVLDVIAGDRADRVPDKVNILLTDIYDEFGLARNDTKGGFWKHGYFLPSDLPGGDDPNSNQSELIVIDSYPQSFLPGDDAYTWDGSNEEWDLSSATEVDYSGHYALANVYTQYVAYKVDKFEQRWVREGLAYFSEFLTAGVPMFYGGGTAGGLTGDNSLVFIGSDLSSRTDYKHVYMFFLYLWEKYGGNDIISAIAFSPRIDIGGLRDALSISRDWLADWQLDLSLEDVYLDFATANLVDTTYSEDDHNRWMIENLNAQGAIRGTALKWKPTAGKDRPPYQASAPEWGFSYFFTGYGPFDPNPLLEPTEDDLIVFAGSQSGGIEFRKVNMMATTVDQNLSALPFMTQEVPLDPELNRATVPMNPDTVFADTTWIFGPQDDPDATFPTWILVAAGGGDFILHHDSSPATYSRLFIAQNQVIRNNIDLYVVSELPLYRSDGVATPVVYATTDEAGTEEVVRYDSPDDYVQTSVENSSGRFEQYVAHTNVSERGTVYWFLGGYYSNGVPVEEQDPTMVVFTTFPGGEGKTVTLDDGFRLSATAYTFDRDRELVIVRSPESADLSGGTWTAAEPERDPVSDAYTTGSPARELADPVTISVPYDAGDANGRAVGLYLLRNGRWDYVGGDAGASAGIITARVNRLGTFQVMAGPLGDIPDDLAIPSEFALGNNYPNPFNPSTSVQVAIPHTGELKLAVYDVLGREVARLFDGVKQYGTHTFHWDGRSSSGAPLASGVYFLRMRAGEFQGVRKMVLVK